MNKEELIDFLKDGNGIIVNNTLEGNTVIDFMKENDLIRKSAPTCVNFPFPGVIYIINDIWLCGKLNTFKENTMRFNKIIYTLNMNSNEVDIVEESKETNKYFLYYELVYRSNEVIGKDCTIIETENLNDELLHKKKLEIESKFQYSTDEKRRNAKVVFVNIVKL